MTPSDSCRADAMWTPASRACLRIALSAFALFAMPALGEEPRDGQRIVVANAIGIEPPETESGTSQAFEVSQIIEHIRKQEYDQALALASKLTRASPDSPMALKLQGVASMGKGDLANARKSFEKALALKSDDKQTAVYLAQVDLQENNPAGAKARLERIIAADGKYLPAVIGMAQVEAHLKNETGALTWYRKARDLDADAILPRLYLGNYYLSHNDLTAALTEATEATRAHADDPYAVDLLARVQTASGQYSQALRSYRQLVALAPDSAPAHFRLATTQLRLGDLSGASVTLRKALQLKPDDVEAAYTLAAIEIKAGHTAAALEIGQKLQSKPATEATGFVVEGDVAFADRKYVSAQRAYEKAFEKAPSTQLAIKIHQVQEGGGRLTEANARLLEWMNTHPDDIDGWQYLGGAYVRSGQPKAAIAQYERVLKSNPRNVLALNNLAGLYSSERDPRAMSMAEQAYGLVPDSPITADTLGWLLIEQGEVKKGLELVRKALDLDPKNPEVRYHFGVGLARSGNKAEARRVLERLIAEERSFPQRQAAADLLKQL